MIQGMTLCCLDGQRLGNLELVRSVAPFPVKLKDNQQHEVGDMTSGK